MEDDIREFSPDKILATALAKEVLKVLEQSDEAAYKVYLVLATKYGAGQKI